MRKRSVQWTVAVVLTLVSAVWQRWSGPTYPAMGHVAVAGESVTYKLLRTNSITERQPVRVTIPNPAVSGVVEWRHYPTSERWQSLPMVRHGESLETELPPRARAADADGGQARVPRATLGGRQSDRLPDAPCGVA